MFAIQHHRRPLTLCLGLLWLLDAALQFQPYMFTRAFPTEVIRPAGAGSPGWVSGPVDWASSLMSDHIVILNALFATTQLLIGLGLLWRRTTRLALAGSIGWALSVWWLGEGFGGLFAGVVSPLEGLPGAVVLYAVVAVLLWPGRAPSRTGMTVLWLGMWGLFAVESAVSVFLAGGASGHSRSVALMLAVGFAVVAVTILAPPTLARAGVLLAVTLSLGIWVFAQNFGDLATGQSTDPNTGLPLVLLAACFWPTRRNAVPSPAVARYRAGHASTQRI